MATFAEVQQQLLQSLDQIRTVSAELGQATQQIATQEQKLAYLDGERAAKDLKMRELEQAVLRIIANGGGTDQGRRNEMQPLVNLKTMAPKVFDGKVESNFRTWAKKV